MVSKPHEKYLIETDVIIDHLTHNRGKGKSYLIKLAQSGLCFTSVLNASEVYFNLNSENDLQKADHLFYALKVLGIPARYSLEIKKLNNNLINYRDALIYTLARQNNLTIITFNKDRYKNLDCSIINPSESE